jgi:hypothetical protein
MKSKICLMIMVLAAMLPAGSLPVLTGTFVPINTTYSGLFYETNGVWQQSAGLITITTTSRGKYTATVRLGTASYSFRGVLDSNGGAVKDILRRYDYPLTVQFQVDAVDPDLIEGSVGDNVNWTADLFADRAVFDGKRTISTDAGRYTLVIPGDLTSTNTPGGDSYGTITVDKAGRIRFGGVLADGTKVTQSSRVAKGGEWPLYIPLYHGEGALYQWMYFNSSTNEQLAGTLTWIKPEMGWTWYYPEGFAIDVWSYGSRYVAPPKGAKVLDLSTAALEFNGGNLRLGFTNHVMLDWKNHIINDRSANRLSFSFSLSNGLFSGRVMDPYTWEWITFKGVVLQFYGVAEGCFPGWDQSGEVYLEAE